MSIQTNDAQAQNASDAQVPAASAAINNAQPAAADNAQAAADEAATGEQPAVADADADTTDDAAEAAAADEPLTFEQQVERVRKTVNINPRFREIHIHTLGFCQEQRTLTEVEEMIGALPEFPSCDQNQYRLIIFLEDAGGLERLELDEAGNIVTEADKEGLTENEIDDLVWQYAFKTTEAGRAVYDEMQPQKRMSKLGSMFPKRVEAYAQVLDFCSQPRTFKEIDNLLAGSDVLKSGSLNKMTDVALQPSVFIDQLERAGGLVWNGSWNITEAGRGFLEAMTKANA